MLEKYYSIEKVLILTLRRAPKPLLVRLEGGESIVVAMVVAHCWRCS